MLRPDFRKRIGRYIGGIARKEGMRAIEIGGHRRPYPCASFHGANNGARGRCKNPEGQQFEVDQRIPRIAVPV
jgi:hypothetical protein